MKYHHRASGGKQGVTVSDSTGSPSEGDLWWKSNDGNLYIYYDGYWVISTDITTGLPPGVVSGSQNNISYHRYIYFETSPLFQVDLVVVVHLILQHLQMYQVV